MINRIKRLSFIFLIAYPLYFFSCLLPRKKKRWVFGSSHGFYDNSKYVYLQIIKEKHDLDIMWITPSKEVYTHLKQKNLPVAMLNSIKGLKYLFTANIYCLSNYPGMTSIMSLPLWMMGRAKYVQLWHGVGLKKLLYARDGFLEKEKSKHILARLLFKPLHFNILKKPETFLSTSITMNEHFKKCFKLKEKNIIQSNYPRCAVFEKKANMAYLQQFAEGYTIQLLDKMKLYKKIFIYMPTYRENKSDYLDIAGFDFLKLEAEMKNMGGLFILKLHPWTKISEELRAMDYSNILFLPNNIDIYPILPHTDVLITDYSSVYYDYLLIDGKYTVFFDFDRETYLNERDFAFDYDEHTNGLKIKTFNELMYCLKAESYKNINRTKDVWLKEFFWGSDSEKANIIESIKALETQV